MLLVATLIGLLAAIAFPTATAGLDSLRLTTACDAVASFVNAGLVHADQRRVPVELSVSTVEHVLTLRSTEPGWVKRLDLPSGIRVAGVLPPLPAEDEGPRRFLFYPGGTPARIGIELINEKGTRKTVRVNPMTGVPEIERSEAQ
jgi:hypothetical protein